MRSSILLPKAWIPITVVLSILVIGFRFGEQPISSTPTVQQKDANVDFEWAFGVLGYNGKTPIPIPITRDTVLKSGDEIKMMLKIMKECYVYALYLDSQGDLSLLFPYSIHQFQTDYVAAKQYYIPKGRNWMMLDKNTGKEIFFLVASSERLLDLEAKLGNYFSVDPVDRKPLAQDVVTEIRGLRKHYATFATIAEKPLSIGGNIRGDSLKVVRRPDVADIAMEISANNFYSKTITIDHQ